MEVYGEHPPPEPEPDGWPEGLIVARRYVACYGLTLPEAVEHVFRRQRAGGWVSGPCEADRPPAYDPGDPGE